MPDDNGTCKNHLGHVMQIQNLGEELREQKTLLGKIYGKLNEIGETLRVDTYRITQLETTQALQAEQIQQLMKSNVLMERLDQDVRKVLLEQDALKDRVTVIEQKPASVSLKIVLWVLGALGLVAWGIVKTKFGW